jgi:hypothetical protein
MTATSSPYGHCPKCHALGATRERRPNGDDTCVNGHKYPSAKALHDAEPVKAKPSEFVSGTPAVYGGIRLCFMYNKLTAVVLLREDGSCDTPPCDWTTVQLPLRIEDMTKVKIGLDVMDYHRMCGVLP